MKKWIAVLSSIWVFSGAQAAVTPLPLNEVERDRLRYRLEENFNQLDLMIRNQSGDLRDLEKQEREMGFFRVLERIPLEEELPKLTEELRSSAREAGLVLKKIRVVSRVNPPALPSSVWSDSGYRIKPEHTVSELIFDAELQGDASKIREWTRGLGDELVRLVEVRGALRRRGERDWIQPLKAYRYVSTQFPAIRLRSARTLLPTWAHKNTNSFAESEPLLWSFVTRSEELAPRARPLFENRRKFLLNSARMELLMLKTLRKPKQAG